MFKGQVIHADSYITIVPKGSGYARLAEHGITLYLQGVVNYVVRSIPVLEESDIVQ